MIRLSVLLTACLLLVSTAVSAAAPTDTQIDRLLEVTRTRQTVDAVLPQLMVQQRSMAQQMIAGRDLDDAQRQQLDRLMSRTSERMTKVLAWEKLQPLYRDIYRQTFTGEDVEAMVDFYTTQAGQNLLDKMPALMQNTMAAVQTLLVPMLRDLQKDLEAELAASANAAPDEKSKPAQSETSTN